MRSFFRLHRHGGRRRSKSCTPQVEWMESRVQLSAVAWTGAGGDNDWDNPLNWSTDALPASADDVTIDVAADVVHSSAVTDSIRSLTSSQPLTLSGGTISIAAASSTSGPVVINGGTLAGTGDITVGGPLTLTAGTIAGSGAVTANGGIVINPSGTAFSLDGRTLTNSAGQTATWTGADSNVQASNGAVFDNLGTFQAENQGAFTQGSGALATFIDAGSFTKMTSSGELDFLGVGFNTMGGSVIAQTGTLGLLGGGSQTGAAFSVGSAANLDFGGSTAFSLDDATTFSGAGNLIKDGPTTLTLAGNSDSFTGTTTVNDGTLLVDGSLAASSVSVLSGATLGGSGTVGAVTTIGGTLQPGNALGILNIQGNVTLDGTSTIGVDLNGPTPGAGYDQLDVNGAVNLNGSTLSPSLGFSPSSQVFTIIRSTAPINGTFQGLPEGHTLLIGGRLFTISYDSGGGDDVALTVVGPASPPQILTNAGSTTFTVGTTGNFTIDAVGSPVPTWSYTGNLPAGVTFVDNGDGSATLAGKPQAGTGGIYQMVLTAANGVGTAPTEDFTLTVNEAPTITSAAAASFVVGDSNSFTFTTSGFPAAALSESQSLPSGLHFLDNGDGTATLSGIPAAGTGGTHSLIITATNGQGSSVTQDFTLTVITPVGPTSPPQIQPNAAATTFTVGTTGNFTIDAVGSPVPTWSYTGALPAGVIFIDNGDGSATLAGKPQAGNGGTYPLVLTAANGVGTAPTEDFTLTVDEAPTFTNTDDATFSAETAGSFLLTTAGFPTSALSESGPLPSGVTFVDNHNGTATLTGNPAMTSAGAYHLTITASNGVGASVTEDFTVDVVIPTPPKLVRLQRIGRGARRAQIVLSFNQPMALTAAELTSNYVLRPVVRGHAVNKPHQLIRVRSAVYDSTNQTVTLRAAKPLNLQRVYEIAVNGLAPSGLTNVSGVALDGQGNGRPSSNFVLSFAGRASLRGIT
jgi:large repetitive protein